MAHRLPVCGIIGYGQVGAIFAAHVLDVGGTVFVFDRNLDKPGGLAELRERSPELTPKFVSLRRVIGEADVIVSVVPSREAKVVASRSREHLTGGKIFLDLSSLTPPGKRDLSYLFNSSKGDFVEGVILQNVGILGSGARVLLAGPRAEYTEALLRRLSFNAVAIGDTVGRASAVKVVRSLVSKGLEALSVEAFIVAKQLEMTEELGDVLNDFLGMKTFREFVELLVSSHLMAAPRRHTELEDIVHWFEEEGVCSTLAPSLQEFFCRTASFLPRLPRGRANGSAHEVIEVLSDFLQGERYE